MICHVLLSCVIIKFIGSLTVFSRKNSLCKAAVFSRNQSPNLSPIKNSEPTRRTPTSYAGFRLDKKNYNKNLNPYMPTKRADLSNPTTNKYVNHTALSSSLLLTTAFQNILSYT